MFRVGEIRNLYNQEKSRGKAPKMPESGFSENMGHMHKMGPSVGSPFDLHPNDYEGIGVDAFSAHFDTQGQTDEEWLAMDDRTISEQVGKAQPIGICRYCQLFEYIPGTLPPFGECHGCSAESAKSAAGNTEGLHHWVYPYSCCRSHVRSNFDMVRDHKKFTWGKKEHTRGKRKPG